jgi:hypothetical protein
VAHPGNQVMSGHFAFFPFAQSALVLHPRKYPNRSSIALSIVVPGGVLLSVFDACACMTGFGLARYVSSNAGLRLQVTHQYSLSASGSTTSGVLPKLPRL